MNLILILKFKEVEMGLYKIPHFETTNFHRGVFEMKVTVATVYVCTCTVKLLQGPVFEGKKKGLENYAMHYKIRLYVNAVVAGSQI